MTKTHELKTLQPYFDDIVRGVKKFEIRKNDRDFKQGDTLILKEYDHINWGNGNYSGKEIRMHVISIMYHSEHFGLKDGYVIMSIQKYGR